MSVGEWLDTKLEQRKGLKINNKNAAICRTDAAISGIVG